jgi:hypothetical protein
MQTKSSKRSRNQRHKKQELEERTEHKRYKKKKTLFCSTNFAKPLRAEDNSKRLKNCA